MLLSIGITGCNKSKDDGDQNGQKTGSQPQQTSQEVYFKTHFQDESQFLIESVLADVSEMAYFAKHHELPRDLAVDAKETAHSDLDAPSYEITVRLPEKTIRAKLRVDQAIWAPELYAPIGSNIFEALKLAPSAPTGKENGGTEMVASLLQLTATNIEAENEKLSAELERNFDDPNLHERAAMLIGAFAFREQYGAFEDVRNQLCRMTSHLTVARLLRNEANYSATGKVADALLFTRMENATDAIGKIKSLDTNVAEVGAWARALYARDTKDYRALEAVPHRTLAEEFEYFQAQALCLNPELPWEALPENLKTNYADFYHILGQSEESIELGHTLLQERIPIELKEFDAVYKMTHHDRQATGRLADVLNNPPERCFSATASGSRKVSVIGWGQWAAYYQRQLCSAATDNFHFLLARYGSPEDAAAYSEQVNKLFSGLTLFPFVLRSDCTNEATYRSSIDLCYPATQASPQAFNANCWNLICVPEPFAEFYQPFPSPHLVDWFKHDPPPGTAFEMGCREIQPPITERADIGPFLESLHEKDAASWNIILAVLHLKYHDNITAEQLEALLRPVLDYDARSMTYLAGKFENDPVRYEKSMLKAADLMPAANTGLGYHFAQLGDDQKAIEYLKKGMDFDHNGVVAAANAGALMKLYLKHGRDKEASDLVDKAASIYSAAGFRAKADYLEAKGRYKEALNCYDEIEARYGPREDTVAFLLRAKAKTGGKEFDKILSTRTADFFPNGMERVTLASFRKPPDDGVILGGDNAETAKVKLNMGDVIVALHGIRVHNFTQFSFVRDTASESVLDLIVWQGGHYHQIKASPPNRKFGVQMPDYHRGQ